ncbi:unnamed protein product, partial [Prorocentrum cordatum]
PHQLRRVRRRRRGRPPGAAAHPAARRRHPARSRDPLLAPRTPGARGRVGGAGRLGPPQVAQRAAPR